MLLVEFDGSLVLPEKDKAVLNTLSQVSKTA